MSTNTQPIIAREGWLHVTMTIIVALAMTLLIGGLIALIAWLVAVFVLQFFRDPPRNIPSGSNLAVCPADGKVVYVGPALDPYLNRSAFKVSIFMNIFSVHSNRAPVAGVVKDRWYTRGKFINAELDKSSAENERNALWLGTDNGQDVVCVQVAGLVARRILCYVEPGNAVERGQRFGFIRFGSRVDVYLPQGFQVQSRLGDKVKAGSGILGRFGD